MKTIDEYINQKQIIESEFDFIDQDFINYFMLAWNLNHCQIYEELLNETKILYDGQIEQADVIDKEFQNNKNKDTIIISADKFENIKNVYFDKIYIHIFNTKNDEYGVYKQSDINYNDYNDIRWDIKNKKFRFVEINVYINSKTDSIKDLLLHELKHYWDDYNGFKNCKTILDIAVQNQKYNRFIKNYNDNDFTRNVKQINNMFTKIEQNAYISQFIGQITDILKNKKYHSIAEAIKYLIKSDEYKRYKKLKKFIVSILNNKDIQTKYISVYKEITNTNLPDKKIINQLEHKFNHFWFYLQKGIYQYIEDNHLIKESILSKDSKEFII